MQICEICSFPGRLGGQPVQPVELSTGVVIGAHPDCADDWEVTRAILVSTLTEGAKP